MQRFLLRLTRVPARQRRKMTDLGQVSGDWLPENGRRRAGTTSGTARYLGASHVPIRRDAPRPLRPTEGSAWSSPAGMTPGFSVSSDPCDSAPSSRNARLLLFRLRHDRLDQTELTTRAAAVHLYAPSAEGIHPSPATGNVEQLEASDPLGENRVDDKMIPERLEA